MGVRDIRTAMVVVTHGGPKRSAEPRCRYAQQQSAMRGCKRCSRVNKVVLEEAVLNGR